MNGYVKAALAVGLFVLMGGPAHSQVPGQPYQIPPGFEGVAVGDVISYGGATYVIQENQTMILQQDVVTETNQETEVDQTASGVPEAYSGFAPGTTIYHGGVTYLIQENGTMIPANGLGVGGYVVIDPTAYQLPLGYIGYADGSTLSYGGADYVVRNNVMFKINVGGAGLWPHHHGPHWYASGHDGVVGHGGNNHHGGHPIQPGGGHPIHPGGGHPIHPGGGHPGGGGFHPGGGGGFHPGGGGGFHPGGGGGFHPGGGGIHPVGGGAHHGGFH